MNELYWLKQIWNIYTYFKNIISMTCIIHKYRVVLLYILNYVALNNIYQIYLVVMNLNIKLKIQGCSIEFVSRWLYKSFMHDKFWKDKTPKKILENLQINNMFQIFLNNFRSIFFPKKIKRVLPFSTKIKKKYVYCILIWRKSFRQRKFRKNITLNIIPE